MSFAYSNRNGLVLAEHAADERAISAALKRMDDGLILGKDFDERHQLFVYTVLKYVSGDHPPIPICSWRGDDGMPLPLTFGLCDRVLNLRADSRAPYDDPDAHNERLRQQTVAEFEEAIDELARDGERMLHPGHSPVFHPGVHLRRRRARYERGEVV